MKRTPLARRTRIAPISAKRRSLLARRSEVREIVLDRDGGCVGATRLPDIVCAGPVDVHEIVRRSQNANAWLEPDLCVAICRAHHDAVHAHPAQAREAGLLRSPYGPVQQWGPK